MPVRRLQNSTNVVYYDLRSLRKIGSILQRRFRSAPPDELLPDVRDQDSKIASHLVGGNKVAKSKGCAVFYVRVQGRPDPLLGRESTV